MGDVVQNANVRKQMFATQKQSAMHYWQKQKQNGVLHIRGD